MLDEVVAASFAVGTAANTAVHAAAGIAMRAQRTEAA